MKEKSPVLRPLDDGARYGPEVWRVIDGIEFCHWDRWLLRLALKEVGGLDPIEREFRARRRKQRSIDTVAEAMLAQVADLRDRLARAARTAESLLDADERASEWLLKKAFKRVWHDGPNRMTAAMRDTPRRRLEQRALRGHRGGFPVSPARFEDALRRIVGTGYVHWNMTGPVTRMLETEIDILILSTSSDLERLALTSSRRREHSGPHC